MTRIKVFHSHIEVIPYKKGDKPEIERLVSKYDQVSHRRIPICMYIHDKILYLPRGLSIPVLEKAFLTEAEIVRDCDAYKKITSDKEGNPKGKYEPKSDIQTKAINFLCGEDDYLYTQRFAQLGLNLDTGDGKTYASVYAILKQKIRACIITHQDRLKQQWISTFKNMTSFDTSRLCNVSGTEMIDSIINGEIDADIYCVTHQTIATYARKHSWNDVRMFFKAMQVGIKVIDESHKFFENTFLIDCFSDCYKTYYLTATFSRSDQWEIPVYKRAFSSLTRFGEETIDYEEKRKHIKFVVMYFSSKPSYGLLPNIRTNYGFSAYKYIDYELSEENDSLMKLVYSILDKTRKLEGKTLIISPKIETVDIVANKVQEYMGEEVGRVYSKNTSEQNKEALSKNIISSTIKSVGEGVDIKGLRILINLEPVASKALADQVRGRLREYSKEDDTYFFYPVDTTLPEVFNMLKRILPVMKRKCKEIIYYH